MVYSFLLIGQSNAAGRGFLDEAQPFGEWKKKVRMLRNGRWQKMFRPVNPDRSFSGVCLAETFAREYVLADPEAVVGIIPCADGGTKLEQWMPGELLFDNAVNCAKLAMRTSVLTGILWHQGESDCAPELYPTYAERFQVMMDALRKELNMPELPVLVGGLGDYLPLYEGTENTKNYIHINRQLEQLGKEYPNCRFVSAEGLGANPDNLHFCAEALAEFGVRYFEAFKAFGMPGAEAARDEIAEDLVRTELEQL